MSHLAPQQIAAFLDRTLSPDGRREVEAHLVECRTCRVEVLEVQRIAGSVPGPRRWAAVPLLAAAAAAVVLVVTQVGDTPTSGHREPAVQSSVAPTTLVPAGQVRRLEQLTWTSVVGSERYRVAVFDSAGHVLWETMVTDTTVAVPSSVAEGLDAAGHYFWSVRARVAWDRWTESGLTEFRVANAGPLP
jgi:anti-sigma factor RsiW